MSVDNKGIVQPVLLRELLSFGTQNERGSRFVETLLSVIETSRQQERNVFAFVTAVEAHFARRPTPPLLAGV